jgi:hypothetical protein
LEVTIVDETEEEEGDGFIGFPSTPPIVGTGKFGIHGELLNVIPPPPPPPLPFSLGLEEGGMLSKVYGMHETIGGCCEEKLVAKKVRFWG